MNMNVTRHFPTPSTALSDLSSAHLQATHNTSTAMRAPLTLKSMENLIVVSGASRGLGLAFTSALMRRTSATVIGASRAGTSPALEQLSNEFPGRVVPMKCDVTDQAQTKALSARVKAEHGGKIDCVLNVAGLLHDAGSSGTGYMPERSLSSIDAEAMSKVFATNALGPVLLTQAFAPQMSRGAVIANLSARVGSISDNRLGGWWSYRMSKAALNMATVNMAHEVRRVHAHRRGCAHRERRLTHVCCLVAASSKGCVRHRAAPGHDGNGPERALPKERGAGETLYGRVQRGRDARRP